MLNPQLKRGLLNICILQLLKQRDMYGYDIVKIIQGYFPDTDESTVYAILRRLNKEMLTSMYYSEDSNGPKRKYYQLTEAGRDALAEYIDSVYEMERICYEMGILGERS